MTRNRVWLGYDWETLGPVESLGASCCPKAQSQPVWSSFPLYPGFFRNQQQSRPFSVLRAGL